MNIEATLRVKLSELNIDSDNEYLVEEVATRSAWELHQGNLIFYVSDDEDYKNARADMESIMLMTAFEEENQKEMA